MSAANENLCGKTCMVTGATGGIGRAAAHTLAGMGAELVLICRDRAKGERVAEEIRASTGKERVTLLTCDLSSLSDVYRVAQCFLEQDKPLHVLLNNAGVFNLGRRLSADGYEEMFAVNHLAHFLLTNLLLKRLQASAPARVVTTASGAHKLVKSINFDDLQFEHRFRALRAYSHSKLANLLFTHELAKRLNASGVTANAVDPGEVATGLGAQSGWHGRILNFAMKPFLRLPERGAETPVYACASPSLESVTGRYFRDCREQRPKPWATDDEAARRLWEISAQLTDQQTNDPS